jgi:hypothetical protein
MSQAKAVGPDTDGNIAGSNNGEGIGVLVSRTTGVWNTGTGFEALNHLTSGNQNTATGLPALFSDTNGGFNTATGVFSLYSNTSGFYNNAVGAYALSSNIIGSNNTATGYAALYRNTANNNTDGQLGTASSSRRFKKEIKPIDSASEAILALKPVTFHYKTDKSGTPQFGLIAEEVAEVNPDLVVRDEKGDIYTVRYDAVNAMLLNEFLKEHRKVEDLKKDFQATVAQQQKEIQSLAAQLKAQAAQIPKVSAQLELAKSIPQTVAK